MEEKKTETQEKAKKTSSPLKPLLIVALILIVGFAAFISYKGDVIDSITQVTSTSNVEPNEEFSQVEETADTAEQATLDIDYDKIQSLHAAEDVVYKFGSKEIPWEDYYYFYSSVLAENIGYIDPTIDFNSEIEGAGMTYNEFFAAAAEDTLDYYTAMLLYSNENGVTKETVKDELAKLEETYMTNYGAESKEELYKLMNEEFGVPSGVFELINEATVCSGKLFSDLYGENFEKIDDNEALEMIKAKNYMNVQHILLSCYDMATYEKLDEEGYAVKKEQAQNIAEDIKSVEDNEERAKKFEEYAEQYNEDGSSQYCFTEGTMVEEFEDAAKALDEYEVTVVETDYGTHILMKLPLDVNATLYDADMTAKESLANTKFMESFQEYREKVESGRTNNFEIPDLNEFKK